jgi:hypothetical protein
MRRLQVVLALALALLAPLAAPPVALASPTSAKVRRAIRNTDPAYLEKVLSQRNPGEPGQRGSVFLRSISRFGLARAAWKPYRHPAVGQGTEAFVAPIPGRVGVVPLDKLPPATPIRFEDPKGLGAPSAVVDWVGPLPRIDFSVLIVGRDEASGRSIVFTVHPGAPVVAARPRRAMRWLGMTVRADEAIALGFTLAKVALPMLAPPPPN